jgi:hypothetical protein
MQRKEHEAWGQRRVGSGLLPRESNKRNRRRECSLLLPYPLTHPRIIHYPLRMMFGHVKNLDKGGDAVCLRIISSRGSQDSKVGGGGGGGRSFFFLIWLMVIFLNIFIKKYIKIIFIFYFLKNIFDITH